MCIDPLTCILLNSEGLATVPFGFLDHMIN